MVKSVGFIVILHSLLCSSAYLVNIILFVLQFMEKFPDFYFVKVDVKEELLKIDPNLEVKKRLPLLHFSAFLHEMIKEQS